MSQNKFPPKGAKENIYIRMSMRCIRFLRSMLIPDHYSERGALGDQVSSRGNLKAICGSIHRLRVYIFVGMLLSIVPPFLVLAKTNYAEAYAREIRKVEQSHLIIAENLASTLQRYAVDTKNTFEFIVANPNGLFTSDSLAHLLESYRFRLVASFGPNSELSNLLYTREFDVPSKTLIETIRKTATSEKSIISGVQQSAYGPVMYIAALAPSGDLVVGAVDTSFVVEQQGDIAFGARGHAMIVDHEGRVLAHPKKEWTDTSKDVSTLEVVQRMTSGETGVMQFYAPPLKAQVVAGYTFVTSTGWGAMVPQPISELAEAASNQASRFQKVFIALFFLAAVISWFVSGLIARPVRDMSYVVSRVRGGDLSARVPNFGCMTPTELKSLGHVFNGLLDNWSSNREMLESSLAKARDANLKKSQAISVLSHEMRTPLNGVAGSLELLERTELTKLQEKYVGFANSATAAILRQVESVLEVTRLDSSNIELKRDRIHLPNLVDDIVQENAAQAERDDTKINVCLAQSAFEDVETDERLLRSVVANLVGNAVKFAAGGQIDISVEIDPHGVAEISVKDNGPGIDKHSIKEIFKPFTVLDASFSRRAEGSGLGLNIVATCIEALDGEITVNSQVGTGCEFRALVPVAFIRKRSKCAESQVSKTQSSREIEIPEQHDSLLYGKVLVVDDNEVNRLIFLDMLENLGLDVSVASNGPDAIELAMKERFDQIFMDVSMPIVDGTEVARLLRGHDGPNQSTEITAITAHASPKDRDRIIASGMQSVLVKPISSAAFRSSWVGAKIAGDPSGFNEAAARSVPQFEALELLVSTKGVDATEKILRELIGEAALVIRRLRSRNSHEIVSEDLISQIHNISGTSAALGAHSLHKNFYEIEDHLKRGENSSVSNLLETAERALQEASDAIAKFLVRFRQA